jgi:MoxR-like ATPase
MSTIDVRALTEEIKERSQFIELVLNEASQVVVGQKVLLERLLMALLCDGHVLLEGLPGLAKTLTIKTLEILFMPSFSAFSSRRIFCPRISWER